VDKKDFKNKILAMLRQSLEPSTVLSNIGPCERYSTVDYDRYTGGTMSLEAVRIFEDHCRDCPSCLKGLVQSHERFIREKAQSENKILFQKTMDLLDRLERNVISIFIEQSKDILKVIKTTGEILPMRPVLALRGENDESEKEQSVRILQEFVSPPVSIQASFERHRPGDEMGLTVSVFDKQSEEFIPDIKVKFEGDGVQEEAVTDQNGEVTFIVSGPGDYEASLESGSGQMARLDMVISFV
jgi:hypothetical protein